MCWHDVQDDHLNIFYYSSGTEMKVYTTEVRLSIEETVGFVHEQF